MVSRRSVWIKQEVLCHLLHLMTSAVSNLPAGGLWMDVCGEAGEPTATVVYTEPEDECVKCS